MGLGCSLEQTWLTEIKQKRSQWDNVLSVQPFISCFDFRPSFPMPDLAPHTDRHPLLPPPPQKKIPSQAQESLGMEKMWGWGSFEGERKSRGKCWCGVLKRPLVPCQSHCSSGRDINSKSLLGHSGSVTFVRPQGSVYCSACKLYPLQRSNLQPSLTLCAIHPSSQIWFQGGITCTETLWTQN